MFSVVWSVVSSFCVCLECESVEVREINEKKRFSFVRLESLEQLFFLSMTPLLFSVRLLEEENEVFDIRVSQLNHEWSGLQPTFLLKLEKGSFYDSKKSTLNRAQL